MAKGIVKICWLLMGMVGVLIGCTAVTPPPHPTGTPAPTPSPTFDMDAFFQPVDPLDLQADPEKYELEALRLTGEVFHIEIEGNRVYFHVLTQPGGVNVRSLAVDQGLDLQVGDIVTVYASGFGATPGITPTGETAMVPTVEVVRVVRGRR